MKGRQCSGTAFSIHWTYWVLSIPPKDYYFQFKGFFCYVAQLPHPEIVITSTEYTDQAEKSAFARKQIYQTRKIGIC